MQPLILLFLLVSACAHWPPHGDRAPVHFAAHRDSLAAMQELFHATGLAQVEPGAAGLVGRVSFEDPMVSVAPPQGERLRELFARTGAIAASRHQQTDLFLLGSQVVEATEYSWHYATGGSPPARCVESMQQKPCGRCGVPLKNGWWVDYRWRPTDVARVRDLCHNEP